MSKKFTAVSHEHVINGETVASYQHHVDKGGIKSNYAALAQGCFGSQTVPTLDHPDDAAPTSLRYVISPTEHIRATLTVSDKAAYQLYEDLIEAGFDGRGAGGLDAESDASIIARIKNLAAA